MGNNKNWRRFTKIIILSLLLTSCYTVKYKAVHCINKPILNTFKCMPECGVFVSDNEKVQYECLICAEDLKNILTYYNDIDIYYSDKCMKFVEVD